jgi:hypothetical protein
MSEGTARLLDEVASGIEEVLVEWREVAQGIRPMLAERWAGACAQGFGAARADSGSTPGAGWPSLARANRGGRLMRHRRSADERGQIRPGIRGSRRGDRRPGNRHSDSGRRRHRRCGPVPRHWPRLQHPSSPSPSVQWTLGGVTVTIGRRDPRCATRDRSLQLSRNREDPENGHNTETNRRGHRVRRAATPQVERA